MRSSILSACALALLCVAFSSCEKDAIPSDELGVNGITQGVISYDTIRGMREASADTVDVAEAIRIGMAIDRGSTTPKSYYILGCVSGWYNPDKNQFDPAYGNLCPIITNKLNNRNFVCYRLMSFKGEKFTSADQIQKGDIIVVYGQIQNYNGVPQLTSGGRLVTSNNPASGYVAPPMVVLSESFAESLGEFSIKQTATTSGDVWQWVANSSGDGGYARALSTFNDAIEATESRLVSPTMDLTTCKKGVTLTFSHYYVGAEDRDAQMKVMISTDGSNWTTLTLDDTMWNNGKQRRFTSATIDITEYISSTTQIAFVYTATATNAPTWALQNIRVGEPEE